MSKDSVIVSTAVTPPGTFIEKVLGSFCLSTFVFVWLSSAVSPILFVFSIVHKWYMLTIFILCITLLSYLPWQTNLITTYMRRFIHVYAMKYFQKMTIIEINNKTDDNTDNKKNTQQQTLYAIHPHGAYSMGWSMLYCSDEMQKKKVRFCFSPYLFATPFFRLYSRITGTPGSANRLCMEQYISNGESVAIPPGGFEEATITSSTIDRVYIKNRYGIIRLALQHGIAIRPVYVFGEKQLFYNIQGYFNFRLWLNKYGIPGIISWGLHPLIPLLPKHNVTVTIVIGKPLIVPKLDHKPSIDEIQIWHTKYISELQKLFDEYKEYAYGSEIGKVAKIEIW